MNACLIYGYAQRSDGTLDYQTMARCDVGAALYSYFKVRKIFLTVEVSKAYVPMAQAMKAYLLRCNDIVPDDIVILPFGRNTAGETDALLANTDVASYERIYVVSTWYHIPRILFLWWTRRKFPRPAIAWRGAHVSDVLVEPLKMLNSLVRPFQSAKIAPAPLSWN